jgi:hypothetical protein
MLEQLCAAACKSKSSTRPSTNATGWRFLPQPVEPLLGGATILHVLVTIQLATSPFLPMDISWLHICCDSIPVGQPVEDDSDSWFCDGGYIKSLFSLARGQHQRTV